MINKIQTKLYFLSLSIFIVLTDQFTKYLMFYNYKKFINKDFLLFKLDFVKNYGAAFNIFSGNRIFLSLISIIFSILLIYLIFKKNNLNILDLYSYSFILGGTIGNGIDRILKGFVIDFINLNTINFPVFNIADISINIGFIFLGLASISEMIDHTQTSWIYVDHSSLFNWLFYSFLSLGLTCLSISVIKNKFIQKTNFCISLCSIISYFLFDKSICLLFQVIISILLIINWQRVFKDWLFVLYPLFGIFFTTLFGTRLSISGDQFWHVLIGPSGTISVITFYLVLKRSDKKFT